MSVYVIAEAGVNHNGSVELAKKMVYEAKNAGADAVKFQTAIPELVVTSWAEQADYQKVNALGTNKQLDLIKKILFPIEYFREIQNLCVKVGIEFLSTAFDLKSLEFLHSLNMPQFKIPSGEITNLPYLRQIAKFGKPVILSTGMSTKFEISQALEVLMSCGVLANQITILHCTTEYPTPDDHANLRAISDLRETFRGHKVGYSDHTIGIEASLIAISLGATVIEKHFTLDQNLPGPDHKASIDYRDLKLMIDSIRKTERLLSGSGKKEPFANEMENAKIVRRSIVAQREIKSGEVITEDMIITKRPATGLHPFEWDRVLGSVAKKDFHLDDLIEI